MSDIWVQQYQDYVGVEVVDFLGLEVKCLMFFEVVVMIVGINIGVGVLFMVYVSCKVGFMLLLFWLVVVGLFIIIFMFYVLEIVLCMCIYNQLSGFVQCYVGFFGVWVIFLFVVVNSIGVLIVYMSGSGKIFSVFFGISLVLGSVLFFILVVGVLYLGLSVIGKGEKFISIGMVSMILILVVVILFNDNIEFVCLFDGDWIYMVLVFNIVVFCFFVQYIVLEMVCGFSYVLECLLKVVIIGMLIIFVLFSIVLFLVIVLIGLENQFEVVILVWGKVFGEWVFFIVNIFVLCVMLMFYWGLGGSFLINIFDKFYKFGLENWLKICLLVLVIVVLLLFVLVYSGLVGFVNVLYFVGVFSGVIFLIMLILMLCLVCRNGDFELVWKCGWIVYLVIQVVIVMIYLVSVVYVICSVMNLLLVGWQVIVVGRGCYRVVFFMGFILFG